MKNRTPRKSTATATPKDGHALMIAAFKVELALYAQRAFLERAMMIDKDENATKEQKDKALADYQNAKDATLAYKMELANLSR